MELKCPTCEAKLRVKSKKLRENVAFRCPKCKNTILYKDSQVIPFKVTKLPDNTEFHFLIGSGQQIKLERETYHFRVENNFLTIDSKSPDFSLKKQETGYLIINCHNEVIINGDLLDDHILCLGDSLDIKGINLIYADGFIFNPDNIEEKELTSGDHTLQFDIGNNKEKWKEYLKSPVADNPETDKAELVIESDLEEKICFELNKEGNTTIGRGFTDISMMDLRMSKKHAVIYYSEKGKAFILEDMSSTNGTFVNGQKIKKQTLKNGDIIQIGCTYFKFTAL